MEIEPTDFDTLADVLDELRAEGLAAEPLDGEWFRAVENDVTLGVARIFERDGDRMLEDVWVRPDHRRKGIGAALVGDALRRHRPLWLICDEDMVAYYGRLGFKAQPDLPPGLASLNTSKGYWQPNDHVHVAMRT